MGGRARKPTIYNLDEGTENEETEKEICPESPNSDFSEFSEKENFVPKNNIGGKRSSRAIKPTVYNVEESTENEESEKEEVPESPKGRSRRTRKKVNYNLDGDFEVEREDSSSQVRSRPKRKPAVKRKRAKEVADELVLSDDAEEELKILKKSY